MRAVHIPLVITLFYAAATLFCASTPADAADPQIRRAATRSPSADISGYRYEERATRKNRRLGFSPLPYQAERAPRRQENRTLSGSMFPDIRGVVKLVNRSVVSIRMLEPGSSWSLGGFGLSKEDSEGKAMGYGSGFIVSEEGHIVTNEHVLRNGTTIEVELLDGRKYSAKVLHKDSKNDLALIKINAKTALTPVSLGDSDGVELGEWVIGIGNPYGIGQSLMVGIVSARKRTIPGSGYPPLIQIDAAMNLGNSGGPLFNLEGQVIGINTILLWKSQGIGFATPVNVAKRFLRRGGLALAEGRASRPVGRLVPASVSRSATRRADGFNPLDPPWKSRR